jgi:phosphonate transport system substrate-binding protein
MYRLSYYPWLTQNVPPELIDREIRRFASIIESQLEQRRHSEPHVEVLPPLDVPEQIDQIVNKQAEIALMNPLGLIVAQRRSESVSAVAVALRFIDGKVGRDYFSQLYTNERTGIRTLADVVGRSIAYGLPYSASNFLIPAFMLHRAGVHPLFAFSRIEFLKGHEVIARAVYEGTVDIGAGHDGVITDLSHQTGFGDAATRLVQIARSDPLASDPVVVNVSDEGERTLLQESIVAAGNTDPGKETLKVFWGNTQGLEPTDSAAYEGLRDAFTALKLDETDLFRSR